MRRAILIAVLAVPLLALSLALGACGKKAELRAPDGEAEAYTYPLVFPKPASVIPGGIPAGSALEPPRSRERPAGAGDISIFPRSRTTTTYGDPDDTEPAAP